MWPLASILESFGLLIWLEMHFDVNYYCKSLMTEISVLFKKKSTSALISCKNIKDTSLLRLLFRFKIIKSLLQSIFHFSILDSFVFEISFFVISFTFKKRSNTSIFNKIIKIPKLVLLIDFFIILNLCYWKYPSLR